MSPLVAVAVYLRTWRVCSKIVYVTETNALCIVRSRVSAVFAARNDDGESRPLHVVIARYTRGTCILAIPYGRAQLTRENDLDSVCGGGGREGGGGLPRYKMLFIIATAKTVRNVFGPRARA